MDAEVVLPCLPIASGVTPRSWVISNDGSLIAIGYEEGMVQVRMYILLACQYLCAAGVVSEGDGVWELGIQGSVA